MGKILDLYRRKPGQLSLTDVDASLYIKQILRSCIPNERIDAILGADSLHAVLLSGEAGTGKQTLSDALAHEIVDVDKDAVYISLSLWLCQGEKELDFSENIKRLFEEIAQEALHHPILVFLDNLEAAGQDPVAGYMMYQCIQSMKENQVPCTILCAAEDDAQISEQLKKTLIICKTEKPDTLARANYFKRTFENSNVCERYLTADIMAQMTYGFTYSQLKLCVQIVLMGLKQEIISGNTKAVITKKMFEYNAEQMRKTSTKKNIVQTGESQNQLAGNDAASSTQSYTLKTEGENIQLMKPAKSEAEETPQKSYLEIFEELEDLDEF